VKELNADIEDWIENWNADPKPYVWVKTADQILEKLAGDCNAIDASGRSGAPRPRRVLERLDPTPCPYRERHRLQASPSIRLLGHVGLLAGGVL
jgi:hypothetical protein